MDREMMGRGYEKIGWDRRGKGWDGMLGGEIG